MDWTTSTWDRYEAIDKNVGTTNSDIHDDKTGQSTPLVWRHNRRDGVSNHQPHDCLLNRLFSRRSKKTPKLCVTGLCAGKSPETREFPAQRASNGENVSIWWRHHATRQMTTVPPFVFLSVMYQLIYPYPFRLFRWQGQSYNCTVRVTSMKYPRVTKWH